MSNQSLVQQAVRDSTGTALDYNGDWSALFDADGIAVGPWSGRMLAWINSTLGTSYVNVNEAMQAFAVDQGFYNWASMNTFSLSLAAALLGSETQGLAIDFTDGTAVVRDTGTPANNYNSTASGLLTYTSPSAKYILNSSGVLVSGSTIRTEYDSSGNPLGVRVEEARTNLCLQSSNFASNWLYYTDGTTTVNSTTAPDGTLTAAAVADTAGNAYHTLYQGGLISYTSGTVYTASIYLKYKDHRYVGLRGSTAVATGQTWAIADMLNGTVAFTGSGLTSASLTAVGTNGWYRFVITYTSTSTASDGFAISLLDAATVPTDPGGTPYVGTGTGVYIWGPQCEVGAFATSYIPTTTATVTRAADNISLLASAFPDCNAAATLYIKWRYTTTGMGTRQEGYRHIEYYDNGSDNRSYILAAPDKTYNTMRTAGVAQSDIRPLSSVDGIGPYKAAFAWASNDANACLQGTLGTQDVTISTMTGATHLSISLGTSGVVHTRHVQQVLVIPRRMSDADMQTLTT